MKANRYDWTGRTAIQFAALLGAVALLGCPLWAQQIDVNDAHPAVPSISAPHPVYVRPAPVYKFTYKNRLQDYWMSTYQPSSVIAALAGAAYSQASNYPPEWKQGWNGYGKRVLDAYGGIVVSHTISFGVAALDHEDPRYVVCDCAKKDFARRFKHVVVRTVVSPRDGGGRTLAYSRLIGDYGAGFVANAWYPDAHSNATNALRLGTFNILTDLGGNFLREFIRPHIKGWGP